MKNRFVINSNDDVIYTTALGKIVGVFPIKHAISIIDNYGSEALIYMDLDTVNIRRGRF